MADTKKIGVRVNEQLWKRFVQYVEDKHGPETYRLDLASRVIQTRSFWARIASYTAAFVAAPFIIAATGNNAAIAFAYGVVVMAIMPMVLDATTATPVEAAMHE